MNQIESNDVVEKAKAPQTSLLKEMKDVAVHPLRDLLEKRNYMGLAEELNRLIKDIDEDPDIPKISPKSIRGMKGFMESINFNRGCVNDYAHFGMWADGDLNFEMRLNKHTNKDTHFVITGLYGNWLSYNMIISTPRSFTTNQEGEEDTRLRINGKGLVYDVVKLLESVLRSNDLSSVLEDDDEEEVSPPLPDPIPVELVEKHLS